MSTRNLYALLVGINNYNSPVGKLTGPVNDVNKWKEYLQKEDKNFKVDIKTLEDKEEPNQGLLKILSQFWIKPHQKMSCSFFMPVTARGKMQIPYFIKLNRIKHWRL